MDIYQEYLKKTGVYGKVLEVRHPLIFIEGLPEVRPNETIIFEGGQRGQILDIEEKEVHALLFSNEPVPIGAMVTRTNESASVPVTDKLLGRIVNPLGIPLGETEPMQSDVHRPIFSIAPGIEKRSKINEPFATGILKIDLLIPLGKGQRELILGDVKTGKTTFLLSSLLSQSQQPDTVMIYAAIGKRRSEINQLVTFLTEHKIMDRTIMVATSSSDSPSILYLTPYAAMSMAEFFIEKGTNVVLVLDDLSTHGQSYRELSLLSRRFPGRESYPGDIFYAHASLLERAGCYHHPEKGAVSITCLPIATTVEGDITGYIATNLMGMTDGHIMFDVDIYNKGERPAINIPISVTRVGRQSQTDLFKGITVEILSMLSQYNKLLNISHLGSELSADSKRALEKGKALSTILQQEKGILPRDVQAILFGLVWLETIDFSTEETYMETVAKIMQYYQGFEGMKTITELTKSPNVPHFLDELKKTSAIIGLCKPKTAS